jgi:hypothetical protein
MINKKLLGLLGVVTVTMAITGCSKEKWMKPSSL